MVCTKKNYLEIILKNVLGDELIFCVIWVTSVLLFSNATVSEFKLRKVSQIQNERLKFT